MTERLRVQRGGQGEPVLLLVHGLAASGDVWEGLHALLRERWSGSWVTPDLPGHGGSARLAAYGFAELAAAVAEPVAAAERVVVLGHSLGGVVALALASGACGARVSAACGLGIKVVWSDDELARARALAQEPQPVYATRREAAERHLELAGLAGLVSPDAVPDAALRAVGDGWTLAFDSAAFAVGAPDMPALLGAARAPVLLAAGERDPLCRSDALECLVSEPVILPGLGHNAHVESPAALWPLLERLAEARDAR